MSTDSFIIKKNCDIKVTKDKHYQEVKVHRSEIIKNSQSLNSIGLSKGGGMYLIFLVIVLVIVLLQCLSYSFGQSYRINIAKAL